MHCKGQIHDGPLTGEGVVIVSVAPAQASITDSVALRAFGVELPMAWRMLHRLGPMEQKSLTNRFDRTFGAAVDKLVKVGIT